MEHLRVISVQDVSGTSLLFLANNFREAELLVCGLKLLLERETVRLGVRGGLPLSAFGGRHLEGAMSPSAARGFRDLPSTNSRRDNHHKGGTSSGYISSDAGEESVAESLDTNNRHAPKGRRSWGNVPGRDYMRGQAATMFASNAKGANEQGVPHYVHRQQVIRDVARDVLLPLPLPLCRVLLLDSTSPVIKKWEKDRGDKNFEKSKWSFPPSTPRELERHTSEHQLIASGSMCGAARTTSFDRLRYGSIVRLSETHSVDADDTTKIVLSITERNPRRGFSVKVRILLRARSENGCSATVIAELRPVGKDMSNQAAVHKAFILVMDEIKLRYGSDGLGLLAGFLKVVDNMAEGSTKVAGDSSGSSTDENKQKVPRPFPRTGPIHEEKKTDYSSSESNRPAAKSGLVSFEDMLKTGRQSPETLLRNDPRPSTPSVLHKLPEPDPSKRVAAARTSSLGRQNETLSENLTVIAKAGAPYPGPASEREEPRLIEVKPLPKIRLSLMPSPREEDEDDYSSSSAAPSKPVKKKKKKRSKSKTRTPTSITRTKN